LFFCRDDDDINDVATMGGVNLTEESRNILASSSEIFGAQTRSCKDEYFLNTAPLLNRICNIGKILVQQVKLGLLSA
jgi:transcription initiation factor TFIID subunit 4